jgi:hypothetical protein
MKEENTLILPIKPREKINMNFSQLLRKESSLSSDKELEWKLTACDENTSYSSLGDEEDFDTSHLLLKVIDAKYLQKESEIILSPKHISTEKDKNFSGYFMFGKNSESNAFNFPLQENVAAHQFSIGYDATRNKYFLKDTKEGTGVFIKVDTIELREGQIVSFLNTYVVVQSIERDILKVKVLNTKSEGVEYAFDPFEKKQILLGRKKGNDIECMNEGISRIQCTFTFNNNRWYLSDGGFEKPSRNGIWQLVCKQIWIEDEMVIKTGFSTFKATLI